MGGLTSTAGAAALGLHEDAGVAVEVAVDGGVGGAGVAQEPVVMETGALPRPAQLLDTG